MALGDIIGDIERAMDEQRKRLAEVERQIDELGGKRNSIVNQSPHIDDIVASFERGLEAAEKSFKERLGSYINGRKMSLRGAGKEVASRASQLLMLGAGRPKLDEMSTNISRLLPHSALAENQLPLDAAAVTYFLRDQIRADLPSLIEGLFPGGTNGVKSSDREKALKEVDAEIAALEKDRDRLKAEIQAATKALYPHQTH
jgi:outer membrane murein-binding lipoprotein Lpp